MKWTGWLAIGVIVFAVMVGCAYFFGFGQGTVIQPTPYVAPDPEPVFDAEISPAETQFTIDRTEYASEDIVANSQEYSNRVAYERITIRNTGNIRAVYALCYQPPSGGVNLIRKENGGVVDIEDGATNYIEFKPDFFLLQAYPNDPLRSLIDLDGEYRYNIDIVYGPPREDGEYCLNDHKFPAIITVLVQ